MTLQLKPLTKEKAERLKAAMDPNHRKKNKAGEELLSPNDEVRLAEAMKAGLQSEKDLVQTGLTSSVRKRLKRDVAKGRAARDEMITKNLGLVNVIAAQLQSDHMDYEDLVSEGTIGLMRAVDMYDPAKRRGGKFSTYAQWWIKQAIYRASGNQGRLIRLPIHVVSRASKIARLRESMSLKLGYVPSDEELHEETGVSLKTIKNATEQTRRPSSLDTPIAGAESGDTRTYGDCIPDTTAEDATRTTSVNNDVVVMCIMLKDLPQRERDILLSRFGIGKHKTCTLEELGRRYGVTRERIRQLQDMWLAKLRVKFAALEHPSLSQLFKDNHVEL